MKKILSIVTMLLLIVPNFLYSYYDFGQLTPFETKIINLWFPKCENIKDSDIPTIFIPGILASWYSQEWFEESKVKRRIADPITHVYDTLIYTFAANWYNIEDVFYKDEFHVYIDWDPKNSLYVFWYDWKKDNKITATLLNQLIEDIQKEYFKQHNCEINKVNIIAHSMWWLVARSMLEDMCIEEKYMSEESYYKDKIPWMLKNYKSVVCKDNTKIDKLITIATPHR